MYRIGARHFPIRECLQEKSIILESAVIIFILSLSRKRLLIRENTFPCHMEKVIDDVFSTVLMVRPEHAESSERAENSILIKSVWR